MAWPPMSDSGLDQESRRRLPRELQIAAGMPAAPEPMTTMSAS